MFMHCCCLTIPFTSISNNSLNWILMDPRVINYINLSAIFHLISCWCHSCRLISVWRNLFNNVLMYLMWCASWCWISSLNLLIVVQIQLIFNGIDWTVIIFILTLLNELPYSNFIIVLLSIVKKELFINILLVLMHLLNRCLHRLSVVSCMRISMHLRGRWEQYLFVHWWNDLIRLLLIQKHNLLMSLLL
jgi:hypothetical protein